MIHKTLLYRKILNKRFKETSNNHQTNKHQTNKHQTNKHQASTSLANKRLQGFTLIESLVALSIISITVAALSTTVIGLSKANRDTHLRREAVKAGTQVLENYRVTPFDTIDRNSTPEKTVNLSGNNFLVKSTFCENSEYCSSNLIHIRVDVSLDNRPLHTAETVFVGFDD